MNRPLAITLTALAVFLPPLATRGQRAAKEQSPAERRRRVADELNAADCAYWHDRLCDRLPEAQRHVEKALELDPSNRRALYLLARILYAHYGYGGAHDEETSADLARQTIAAYKRILRKEPRSEEAFRVIAAILRSRRENEDRQPDPGDDRGKGAREWVRRRASDESLPGANRALAFVDLAEDLYECSRDVPGEAKGGPGGVQATAEAQVRLGRARRCASEALEMAESAARLDRGLETAWQYKAAALRRLAEFAESDGDSGLKEDFLKRAEKAERRAKQVEAANEKSGRPGDTWLGLDLPPYNMATPAAAPDKIRLAPDQGSELEPEETTRQMIVTPGAGYETVVTTGVLNGLALSMPEPPDPRGAGEGRAGGEVRVRVVIDERGGVISARPLTGRGPLRAAAAAAARRATFPVTRLHCEPVKVVGVLVYEFAGG
ncbi:MAG TPA: hypothetical protein VG148_05220 [Pyrinomonadaceae bacterium]|nr:hypothetical protein [Pyrinomonadaceae bacterium]